MREYRAQLDADRNSKLSKGTNNAHLRAQVSHTAFFVGLKAIPFWSAASVTLLGKGPQLFRFTRSKLAFDNAQLNKAFSRSDVPSCLFSEALTEPKLIMLLDVTLVNFLRHQSSCRKQSSRRSQRRRRRAKRIPKTRKRRASGRSERVTAAAVERAILTVQHLSLKRGSTERRRKDEHQGKAVQILQMTKRAETVGPSDCQTF